MLTYVTMVGIMLAMAATLALVGVAGGQEEGPIADIQQGTMKGSTMTSRLGRKFYAFRGIPYAKPPLGSQRFQAPEPAGPWEGVLDASKDAPECMQKNYLLLNPTVTGQEDCLYLNVYTPKVSPPYGLLPVMVYIHGGGFFSGTGASYINGPEFLLDKEIVLVTFNYRLGALGFLSTGTDLAPGNAGFKDQVEVLRWVSANIAAFGGDPHCVTLFGQSAGAASVHLHMLSPLSLGLFHRAITESGSALSAWARPIDPWPVVVKQATVVNCPTTTPEEMVKCLQEINATTLVDSGDAFHSWSIDTLTTFRPVVENGGSYSFLPNDPLHLIIHGQFANVPWISGVVSQEGIIRAVSILTNETLLADLNSRPHDLFPFLMELHTSVKNTELVPAIWKNISNFYFGTDNPVINDDNYQKFIDLYSDRAILHGFYKSTILHSHHGHDDQYLYFFNYRGKYSFSSIFAPTQKDYGVSHCDELIYLFSTPILFPGWEPDHPDIQVIDNLVTLWTNFAKFGKPTPETVDGSHPVEEPQDDSTCTVSCTRSHNIVWEPYVPDRCSEANRELTFLNISAAPDGNSTLQFCMERGFFLDRLQFWDSLPLRENEEPVYIPYSQALSHILYYTTMAF